MDIGIAIKKLRQSQHLTQKEFCKDILSTSFLSKVENGEHRISAEDLFLILKENKIDIQDFCFMINAESIDLDPVEKISNAYYFNDIDYLKKISKIIPYASTSSQKYYKLLVNIIIHILQDDVESIPKEIIEKAKNQLFSSQSWDELTLKLLVNISFLYEIEILEYFLKDILKKKPLLASSIKTTKLIYSLILNLIYQLLLDKNIEKTSTYIKILEEVPITPELFFQKGLLNFYKSLYDYLDNPSTENKMLIDETIYIFEKFNMDSIIMKLYVTRQ